MAETPLPYIVRAHKRRSEKAGSFTLLFHLVFSLTLSLLMHWTLAFVLLYLVPLPLLFFLGHGVWDYAWKRSLRGRVLDKNRLKGQPCEHCLYDCRGNVSGKCPECGSDIPPDLAERWENWRRTFWLVRLRGYFGGHR